MVAVRMVRALDMSVEETADILVRCPTWVRDWLRHYDEDGLEGLRDRPRCGRPRSILRNVMDGMVANVAGCRITDDLLCVCAAPVQHVAQSLTE